MQGRALIPLPMGNLCRAGGSRQAWCDVKDVGKIFQVLGTVGRWGCSEHFKPVSLSSRASFRGFGESICERLYKQKGRIWGALSMRIAGGGQGKGIWMPS